MTMLKAKLIRVTLKHELDGTFFITYSPDIRGLLVTGRSEAETIGKTPKAIAEMLEFGGVPCSVFQAENASVAGAKFLFVAIPTPREESSEPA